MADNTLQTLQTRIILRNDSTNNWKDVKDTAVLLKGEVGIEFDPSAEQSHKVRIKVGDGISTWAELDYFGEQRDTAIYQVECEKGANHLTAIATVVGSNTLYKGDIAIVKELINASATGIEEHRQYTAYIYDGTNWAAMDGNYDAENVYFHQDLKYTKQIGELPAVPSSGAGDIAATGKNVKQVFETILAKDNTNPTVTLPTAQITISGFPSSATVEPGYHTSGTVNWSNLSLKTTGSYQYGPSVAGVAANTADENCYTVTYNNGTSTTKHTASGSYTYDVTVGNSNIIHSFTDATVKYTAATNYANSSLGNVTSKKVNAGTTVDVSGDKSCTWTSKRKSFWAFDNSTNELHPGATAAADKLADSVYIRGLASNEFGTKTSLNLVVNAACTRIILAVPGSHTLTEVIDVEGMGLNVKDNFTRYANVYVGGCDATSSSIGSYETTYTVFVWDKPAGHDKHTYQIRLS